MAIAYQVLGEGPVDLVFVPFFGNIRWYWELPLFARFLERLASFSRLILFDKRGMGLSDRPRTLTLETQMDDIRAVLDAVGSERAALLGAIQGSQLCALFAATYPERTRALVLYHPHVAPADLPPAALRSPDETRERWGTRELADEITSEIIPSLADDEAAAALVRRLHALRGEPRRRGGVLPHAGRHRHLRRSADDSRAHAGAVPRKWQWHDVAHEGGRTDSRGEGRSARRRRHPSLDR